MSGLGYTSAQQAAIQQAIQKAIAQNGASGTYGGFNNDINNYLNSTGDFNAQQMQDIQQGENTADSGNSGGVMQNKGGGNSSAEAASWGSNILNSLSNDATNNGSAAAGGNLVSGSAGSGTGVLAGTGGSSSSGAGTGVLNPQQFANNAPLAYSNFGDLQNINPATYTASNYNPTGYSASTYNASGYNPTTVAASPGQYLNPAQNEQFLNQNMQLLQTEMNPTFTLQSQNVDQQMAARGILNSGADMQAQTDLQGQQDAALAGAQVPLVSQGYGYEQSDQAANAAWNQQRATGNAGILNAAGQYNATNEQSADAANAAAKNAAAAYSADAANTAGQFDASANNTANAANAASTNAINEYNQNNYLGVTSADEQNYNNYLQWLNGQGANYGNGLVSGYLSSYAPANSTALSTLGQGANNASGFGADAYNATLNSTGGAGSAFSNAFSGLINQATGSNNNNGVSPAFAAAQSKGLGPGF